MRVEISVQRASPPRVVTCGIRRVRQLTLLVGLRCVAAGVYFPQAQLGIHAGRHYLYSWGGSSTVRRCTADVLSAGLLATHALVVGLAFRAPPRCSSDLYLRAWHALQVTGPHLFANRDVCCHTAAGCSSGRRRITPYRASLIRPFLVQPTTGNHTWTGFPLPDVS